MKRFWEPVILPLLGAAGASHVIEIGADKGAVSTRLGRWARRGGARLDVIDPAPSFDVAALEARSENAARVHLARSLDVLADLLPADLVLVDGDHNWYTVFHELTALYGPAGPPAEDAPIAICHDVGWPYGRRDAYCDPDSIPQAFRHPWAQGGLSPYDKGLVPYGLNARHKHACKEGGPRNGVRTAIQDALSGREEAFRIVWLDVMGGLCVIVPRSRIAARPALGEALDGLELSPAWTSLAQLTEQDRSMGSIALQQMVMLSGQAPVTRASGERPFAAAAPNEVLRSIHQGAMNYRYKGRRMVLDPFDMANLQAMIEGLRPRTIFEIGTFEGGRTLWLADVLAAHGIDGEVVSVDLAPPAGIDHPRIRLIQGDAQDLPRALAEDAMADLQRPFLVIEDSAHDFETCTAVLDFFDPRLKPGEVIVIEDGNVGQLMDWDSGEEVMSAPSLAVQAFLARRGESYDIDVESCDRYGFNMTACPNGWLRRR